MNYNINADYEIPWLAGYSTDGHTIYIDKRLPRYLTLSNGRTIDVYKYLYVHESTEKGLEDEKDYKYQYAHEKATKVEREAVESDGINWDEYQSYMLAEVKKLENFNGPLPSDFDDKPEKDTGEWSRYYKIEELKGNAMDAKSKLPVGKVIRMPCMRSGVCQYLEEKILVTKNALDIMANSALGIPVIIEHPGAKITAETIKDMPIVGRVSNFEYSDSDELWYANFIVDTAEAVALLESGYGVSTAWYPDKYTGSGTFNNLSYDRELLKGRYEHLAIVKSPRYEMAKNPVFINSKDRQNNTNRVTINNIQTRSEEMMGKIWKRITSKEEIVANSADMVIEVDGAEMTISDLVSGYKSLKKNAFETEEKEKKEKTEKEEAAKKKNAEDEDAKAKKDKEDKEKAENDAAEEKKAKDEKDAKDKEEAGKKNSLEEDEASLEHARFNALEAAYKAGDPAVTTPVQLTIRERRELGAKRYGSAK